MKLRSFPFAALAALLLSSVEPAEAAPVEYEASAAFGDEWSNGSGGHAFWFPTLAEDIVFVSPGAFTDFGSHWTLVGDVVSQSDPSIAFHVDLRFADVGPSDDMKLELKPEAYADQGGPIDPSTWMFAHEVSGSFTGSFGSAFGGRMLEVSRRGPPAQLGEGANGKNASQGMSSWLAAAGSHGEDDAVFEGDVNVDLRRPTPTPEPGAALLFAFGGLVIGQALRSRG